VLGGDARVAASEAASAYTSSRRRTQHLDVRLRPLQGSSAVPPNSLRWPPATRWSIPSPPGRKGHPRRHQEARTHPRPAYTPSKTALARTSNASGPGPTARKPTAKSNGSTGRCSRNGPTPGPTPLTPNALRPSRPGCTTTITTEAAPHSRVSHPPAASSTSVVNTARPQTPRAPHHPPTEQPRQPGRDPGGMVFALETYCPASDGFSAARIEEERCACHHQVPRPGPRGHQPY